MKKVLITGANGFIAKSIARVLKKTGFYIIGTSRNLVSVPGYDDIIIGVLGEPLKDIFENHKIDAVIHCAYDKDDIENENNAKGTLIWAQQAETSEVGLQIFMSSISADSDALSPYGQKKYEIEKWFIAHNQLIFRLGLVVGNGGLFGRIAATVKKSPFVPLIDNGKTIMYLSDVDTISKIVRDTIMKKNKVSRGRVWYLQQEEPVFFVDILREIRKQFNLFCIFIPVPYFVVSILLGLTEKIKFLKIGVNTNNLKWARQIRHMKLRSDLNYLGYSEIPVAMLIKRLLISS